MAGPGHFRLADCFKSDWHRDLDRDPLACLLALRLSHFR